MTMETSLFPRMHVSLYVANLEQTISFYNAFFGKSPEKQKNGYAKYLLDQPSLIISFVENAERVQQNFGHLGFQVDSLNELNSRLTNARNAGLLTREEIGTNCCYALQDKFWVADPDGIQWEVYYFHADAAFNDPHYEIETSSACCVAPAEQPQYQVKNLVTESCCTPGSGCC